MDPIICCVLGICCPPSSPEQLEAFTELLTQHMGDPVKAEKCAKQLQKDLEDFSKKVKKCVEDEA